MLKHLISGIRLHAREPISKSHFGIRVIKILRGVHLFILFTHQLRYLDYLVKLHGQILGVLTIYLGVLIVNRFLTKLFALRSRGPRLVQNFALV